MCLGCRPARREAGEEAPARAKLAAREAVGPPRPASLGLDGEPRRSATQDAATITEVCSGEELPEVEIISLLEEQIPRYRLRADTLTQFTGYENQDWFVPSPALKPEEADLDLTPDQIRETLNYFILCSNRVSQMTKTYNDIEAVTRLLEEKEKDLELTARIGKELLAHNQKLEAGVAALEAELRTANERLTQLSHEVLKKTELIQVLTNDVDDSSSESGTPTALRCVNLELMQRRIGSLEEENRQLRSEASQLACDTDKCEEAERRLVASIASQLASTSEEMGGLEEELGRCKEESRLQQEQIASLTSKLSDADITVHRLTLEREQLAGVLSVTRDNQAKLATELADLKDRYAEVMGLLHDTQEQLRRQRHRGYPQVRGGSLFPSLCTAALPDSIAGELESSLHSELSLDSGISADRPNYKKVFETVRCALRNGSQGGSVTDSPVHRVGGGGGMVMSSGPRMSTHALQPQGGSLYSNSSLSFRSLDSAGHSDGEFSMLADTDDSYPGGAQPGVPGVPGAADLEAALRRLTPAEVLARRATLSAGGVVGGYDHSPPSYLPLGCRTPDSIMSTGSSGYSNRSGGWKLPEKLQIVKPLEGSHTLAAWAQLATPTMGGLLDDRPGVKTRGGRPLEELGLEVYSLSDLEEDEEYCNPGKSFQNTGAVYTYTTSTVLHPDDTTSVTPSVRGSQMCTQTSSRQDTPAPPTPVCRSRRNSTSTFSTTLGLAKLLNERGIKAVTPSAVPTPCTDRSFTPTATPCNSPYGSPPRSPSPPPYHPLGLPGFLNSGADLLRRTLVGEGGKASKTRKAKRSKMSLSRSERKALTGIRLVEKLERIGLETIMATTPSSVPLTLHGALYSRRTLKSPMAQLTSLKGALSTPVPAPEVPPPLGVPARPGSGALDRARRQRGAPGSVRPDLGTVGTPSKRPRSQEPSALGTISSLLFGRKGGLL
ncbi:trafficking kinesin-binding protein milt isoform X3 [Bacillus rossius redtenbacheri]|uniref:trafficking kinesin-binding protein milt isoform X3 n=1 Tax=Bacillus rossius redtenbacheri TaxID=93214 RepID=UPI002FDEFB4A